MSYPHSDVLCVGAGCGASTAATDFPKTFIEAANVKDAIRLQKEKQHRYVLLNADKETRDELDAQNIDYIIVAQEPYQEYAWTARWLKAGSSAESIKKRLARWAANYDIYRDDCRAPVAIIPSDKWLSQMMEQSRASAADGKDV